MDRIERNEAIIGFIVGLLKGEVNKIESDTIRTGEDIGEAIGCKLKLFICDSKYGWSLEDMERGLKKGLAGL